MMSVLFFSDAKNTPKASRMSSAVVLSNTEVNFPNKTIGLFRISKRQIQRSWRCPPLNSFPLLLVIVSRPFGNCSNTICFILTLSSASKRVALSSSSSPFSTPYIRFFLRDRLNSIDSCETTPLGMGRWWPFQMQIFSYW